VGGDGARRFEQPIEHAAQLAGWRRRRCGEVRFGVGYRTCQDVDLIVQLVERRTGDHQLAVTQFELACSLPRHPVPLPAALRAELPRPATTTPLGQRAATPPTTP
jgi:hypothetical protein